MLGLFGGAGAAEEGILVWSRLLGEASLSRAERLEAGRRLLASAPETLVSAYGKGDNAQIVRQLLYEKRDPPRMRLGLGLLANAAGEEAIDFEVYLLGYGAAAVPGLEALLLRATGEGGGGADVALALRALDALGKLKARSAAAAAADLLGHPDTWLRMGAAHALGEIGDPSYGPVLVQALGDSAYAVQNAALAGLARLRWRAAFSSVVELVGHPKEQVRRHAAHALGELGVEGAETILRRLAAEDPDSGVRYMASRALARLSRREGPLEP